MELAGGKPLFTIDLDTLASVPYLLLNMNTMIVAARTMKTNTIINLARWAGATGLFASLAVFATNSSVADTNDYTFTTFAGSAPTAGLGSDDGMGAQARFNRPVGLAIDSVGNIYVADKGNNTIRKVFPSGTVTTLAGLAGSSGRAAGIGSAARFSQPLGAAVDATGNVMLADSDNGLIWNITPQGEAAILYDLGYAALGVATDSLGYNYTTAGGQVLRHSTNGSAVLLAQVAPNKLVADAAGTCYGVLSNHTVIMINSLGNITTLAGVAGQTGSADGAGSAARFSSPRGLARDGAGNLIIADTGNHMIRKVTLGAVVTVTTVANLAGTAGYLDGATTPALFNEPEDVIVDAVGNIYVADSGNNCIRKISTNGIVSTFVGTSGGKGAANGNGAAARFNSPAGVAVDAAGNVYVSDKLNHTIRKISASGVVSTFAGSPGTYGFVDASGTSARFHNPNGLVVDQAGYVFVADRNNNVIRKITPNGQVTTLAGSPNGNSGSAEGTGASARFNYPSGLAIDSSGNLYVADRYNNRVRRVTPGGVVSAWAGTGGYGSSDGVGTAATFNDPIALTIDPAGVLYVADFYNHAIRRIDANVNHDVTTIAGNRDGGAADGVGAAVSFRYPVGIAFSDSGVLYVSDSGNHTIRRVTTNGVVTTVAGRPPSSGYDYSGSADGTGSSARFNVPSALAAARGGKLYLTEDASCTIRVGVPSLPDVATVDQASGKVGIRRQFRTTPQTATGWQWRLVRRPAASGATLSSTLIPNPTFTPDTADLFVLELRATNAAGAMTIQRVELTGTAPVPYWRWTEYFGWVFDTDTGWAGNEQYGWFWFSASEWIWSVSLQGWLGQVSGSATLWSPQLQWFTYSTAHDGTAYSSAIGFVHVHKYAGTPLDQGWVLSDRFGYTWAAGDGSWFYTTRFGWLGVTAGSGIWCADLGRFLTAQD